MSIPCHACGSDDVKTGVTRLALERAGAMVVVQDVPAEICNACTEFLLDDITTAEVFRLADEAMTRGDASVRYGG